MQRHAEMFANRLRKVGRHRRKWAKRGGIGCYRVYERDIPEIPLIVDRYEGALHVSELQRSASPTGEEHSQWIGALLASAAEALEIAPDRVFLKHR